MINDKITPTIILTLLLSVTSLALNFKYYFRMANIFESISTKYETLR